MKIYPIKSLDDKGRCCGRKPIVYKREGHSFCPRCDRAFDLETGVQVENWMWRWSPGSFVNGVKYDGGFAGNFMGDCWDGRRRK